MAVHTWQMSLWNTSEQPYIVWFFSLISDWFQSDKRRLVVTCNAWSWWTRGENRCMAWLYYEKGYEPLGLRTTCLSHFLLAIRFFFAWNEGRKHAADYIQNLLQNDFHYFTCTWAHGWKFIHIFKSLFFANWTSNCHVLAHLFSKSQTFLKIYLWMHAMGCTIMI